LDEAKKIFLLAANTAEGNAAGPDQGRIEKNAKQDERESLVGYISQLSDEDLAKVGPLFFRRVLSSEESSSLWTKVSDQWEIKEHYWYPLTTQTLSDVEAFQDRYFESEVGSDKIRKILERHGIENVFEFGEFGIYYELEVSMIEIAYGAGENFWFDSSFEWIVYASHESSITIGGWLLEEVKAVWPHWSGRVWTTPFFDRLGL
jgi:hypothetical protein